MAARTEAQTTLKRLLEAHKTYFDVTDPYEYAGVSFDGYAEFHSTAQRYVLTKKATLWEINTHEYLFFKLVSHLDATELDSLLSFMTSRALEKVNPEKDHMTSYLSLVIIADSVDEGVLRKIRKASFHKSFLFGFRGWAEFRLAVIDLARHQVHTNAAGKEMHGLLQANAHFPATSTERERSYMKK